MSTVRVLLRGVPWGPVGTPAGAAVGALTAAAAAPRSWVGAHALWLGVALLASAAGCLLDDPAAAATDACPVDRRRRTAVRALVVVPALLALGLAGLLAAHLREPAVAPWPCLLVLTGAVLTALGVAAVLRRSRPTAGDLAGTGVAVVLAVCSLREPCPRLVTVLPVPGTTAATTVALWAMITTLGAALLVAGTRG